jgi:hypothetical protein
VQGLKTGQEELRVGQQQIMGMLVTLVGSRLPKE